MALKQTIQLPVGVEVADAYHRVECVLVSKTTLEFRVRAYSSANHPACHDVGYVCEYDLKGANPLAQAYLHLKALPEFAGAVDC